MNLMKNKFYYSGGLNIFSNWENDVAIKLHLI